MGLLDFYGVQEMSFPLLFINIELGLFHSLFGLVVYFSEFHLG